MKWLANLFQRQAKDLPALTPELETATDEDLVISLTTSLNAKTLIEPGMLNDIQLFVSKYVELQRQPIQEYGGHIVSIQLDTILAVWPKDSLEAYANACRAAIAQMRTLPLFNDWLAAHQLPQCPNFVIGISTGPCVCAHEGRRYSAVYGQAVNDADAMWGRAKKVGGGIFVDGQLMGKTAEVTLNRIPLLGYQDRPVYEIIP